MDSEMQPPNALPDELPKVIVQEAPLDDASTLKTEISPENPGFFSLFKYATKLDVLYMFLGVMGSVIKGGSVPAFSIIIGRVINDFGALENDPAALKASVSTTALYFVYLALGSAVGAFCQAYFWTSTATRQVNRMRSLYLRRVLYQEMAYFDTNGTLGHLMQGLSDDILAIQDAIGDKIGMFLYYICQFVIGYIIALAYGWSMALVTMSMLPLMFASGFATIYFIRKSLAAIHGAYSKANSQAQQALSNVRTVYAFNGQEKTLEAYRAALEMPTRVGIRQGVVSGSTFGLINCVAFCSYALSMWYGAQKVADGSYSGGQVVTVLFSAVVGGFALGQGSPNLQYFQKAAISAGRIFALMDRVSKIDSNAPGDTLATVKGALELVDIVFAYPARPDKPVFNHFSLRVNSGATVALVGESGSGKSTVVQLLQRFYDPQEGSVLLDGVDFKTLQLRWLRSQMGLVSQEPTLFATTIKENILLGKPEATQEEVEAAAKSANAHTFVTALPMGYDTHVGEKGLQMSGGQKQRIAIARAILKDPRILLLDEATSALDAASERVVQEALDRLMKGRTTVIVAHRLSTVRDADSIAVVYGGCLIEQGNHDELMEKNGAYSTLVHMQHREKKEIEEENKEEEDESKQGTVSKHSSKFGNKFGRPSRREIAEIAATVGKKKSFIASPILSQLVLGSSTISSPLEESSSNLTTTYLSIRPSGSHSLKEILSTPVSFVKPLLLDEDEEEEDAGALDEEPAPKVGFLRLASLSRPELPAAITGILGSIGMGFIYPIFALAFSSLTATFYLPPDEITSGAQKWSFAFMGVGFGSLFAAWLQSASFQYMGQKLCRRVRILMMQALLRQEVGWYDDDKNNSGVLTSKLSTDALAVKGQFGDTMGLLTQNIVTFIAAIVIAGINSWRIMVVVLATLPVLIIAQGLHNSFVMKLGSKEHEQFAASNALAAEAFCSARTVAAFAMEDQIASMFTRSLKVPAKNAEKAALFGGFGYAFSQFASFAVFALAFYYMGVVVSNQQSTFQESLIAVMSVFMAALSISQAQQYFPDVSKGKAATERVFAIVDRKPKIDSSSPDGLLPTSCEGKIELENITFAYPRRPDAIVLKDFSLTIPQGQTLALVGESGSGKSTVIQLIERFYDPLQGRVLLDGVDICHLNIHWLRNQIALVGQEPVLFTMTVADNIRYGKPDATLEAVEAAARAANAHIFIAALPEGYHTVLGEGAIQLSGGQKQRMAIARAVVKDAKIILLDEATSALDNESERMVQDALNVLMAKRTTIIVAHRLSTIQEADSIAVVHKGHLLEQGTHDQLLAEGGAYSKLVAHQMR